MTIESLLSPKSEQNILDGSIVLDIFESVKHARKVYKNSSFSEGDNYTDDNTPVVGCPSHYKIL